MNTTNTHKSLRPFWPMKIPKILCPNRMYWLPLLLPIGAVIIGEILTGAQILTHGCLNHPAFHAGASIHAMRSAHILHCDAGFLGPMALLSWLIVTLAFGFCLCGALWAAGKGRWGRMLAFAGAASAAVLLLFLFTHVPLWVIVHRLGL